jgi:hypothetical protein
MWGIIQKKDTHALGFDITKGLGLKQLTSLIFRFDTIYQFLCLTAVFKLK